MPILACEKKLYIKNTNFVLGARNRINESLIKIFWKGKLKILIFWFEQSLINMYELEAVMRITQIKWDYSTKPLQIKLFW